MSQDLKTLLGWYDHDISEIKTGTFIKQKSLRKAAHSFNYWYGIVPIIIGVKILFRGYTAGLIFIVIGFILLSIRANQGQGSKAPPPLSILISEDEVLLTSGRKATRIQRSDVKDILIRERGEYGKYEAQLFFVDGNGRKHGSITLHGKADDGLASNANRIADHLWNLVKSEES